MCVCVCVCVCVCAVSDLSKVEKEIVRLILRYLKEEDYSRQVYLNVSNGELCAHSRFVVRSVCVRQEVL